MANALLGRIPSVCHSSGRVSALPEEISPLNWYEYRLSSR
ncbi:hypothetical protein E143388_05640 [Rhodococcus opacus]|nr:hypothetical protein E143388_05640 [Rhodococcus opacus]